MFDPKKLEDIAKQVGDAMPAGIKSFGEDVDRKIKQVLQSQLGKLDMVSREEFDVQTHVLLRTREKLAELEKKLTQLEEQLLPTPSLVSSESAESAETTDAQEIEK